MWFIKAIGEFENGVQLPVYADLGENFVYATVFFNYFSDAPIFNTFDLMLDKEPQVGLEQGLKDILNAISEKEEKEVPFPTA